MMLGFGAGSPDQDCSSHCDETWGVFPCSDSLIGSLVLMGLYGIVLLKGANLISDGSEHLLEVVNPGIIGGLVLPILGALPDSAVILFSGLGGDKNEIQKEVSVGMGTLAGSTVMLLTIAWGGSVLLGRCDIDPNSNTTIDKKLTKPFNQTGISVTSSVKTNSIIMLFSLLLYLIPQIASFSGNGKSGPVFLAGALICFTALALYCTYQVVYPELQKRKMLAVHKKFLSRVALLTLKKWAYEEGFAPRGVFDSDGRLKTQSLREMFHALDKDQNGQMDKQELKGFLIGVKLLQNPLTRSQSGKYRGYEMIVENIDILFKEFDMDKNGSISEDEFVQMMSNWLKECRQEGSTQGNGMNKSGWWTPRRKLLNEGIEDSGYSTLNDEKDLEEPLMVPSPTQDKSMGEADNCSDSDDDSDNSDEQSKELSKFEIWRNGLSCLLVGTVVVFLFSDPMVDAINSFSSSSGIPAFFVSFVVTPLASNASELVSSLQFAAKKRKKNLTLTFSQIYGAVTMNNTMCLGVFLALMYFRGLEWKFTAEALTTVLIVVAVGVLGVSSRTIRAYVSNFVLALYPLSIVLVILFKSVAGLDDKR